METLHIASMVAELSTTTGKSMAATTWITAATRRSMFIQVSTRSPNSRCSLQTTARSMGATAQARSKWRPKPVRTASMATFMSLCATIFSMPRTSSTLLPPQMGPLQLLRTRKTTTATPLVAQSGKTTLSFFGRRNGARRGFHRASMSPCLPSLSAMGISPTSARI